jgi:conjugal transfer pilus assembly protein TraF
MKYFLFLFTLFVNRGFCVENTTDSFHHNKTSGWFWYQDPQREKPQLESKETPDLAAQVDFEKEELDRLLKIAIKAPTEENLIRFIKLRNKILDQSYHFGLRLQQANLRYPTLDHLKTYPINKTANELYALERRADIDRKIGGLTKTHGLFYVFKSGCAYCHAFAPTLKGFTKKYGWSLLPITLDGIATPDFPEARLDNGAAQKLNITTVPALIMVEPKTGIVTPIATGVISEEDIVARIDLLTRGP